MGADEKILWQKFRNIIVKSKGERGRKQEKNLVYFPPTGFLPPAMNHTSSRIYNPFGYYLTRAHCNALKFSFLHTVTSVWNNLPHHALTAESFSVYRRAILPLFL